MKRIIRVFKRGRADPVLLLHGGEPLLRGDLEEMIGCARRCGLQVNLITNGTLATPAAGAQAFSMAGLRTAQVSVESPGGETHDIAHRAARVFPRRPWQGIRAPQKAGISVQTNTTVTAINAADAARMPAFLKGSA